MIWQTAEQEKAMQTTIRQKGPNQKHDPNKRDINISLRTSAETNLLSLELKNQPQCNQLDPTPEDFFDMENEDRELPITVYPPIPQTSTKDAPELRLAGVSDWGVGSKHASPIHRVFIVQGGKPGCERAPWVLHRQMAGFGAFGYLGASKIQDVVVIS